MDGWMDGWMDGRNEARSHASKQFVSSPSFAFFFFLGISLSLHDRPAFLFSNAKAFKER